VGIDVPEVHVHGARNAAMLISKELAQLIGCGGKALHSAGCSAPHMDTAVPLDRKASNCSSTTLRL